VISSLECMRQILQSSEKFDWICEEKQGKGTTIKHTIFISISPCIKLIPEKQV